MPNIKPQIVYEDQDILVIDKPSSWIVYKENSNNTDKKYLSNYFKDKFENQEWQNQDRLGFAHRIDEDTQGLVIAGKNPETLEKLQELFKQRKIEKWYIAKIKGQIDKKGIINSPLFRKSGTTTQKISTSPKAKNSISIFYLVNYDKDSDTSLILVYLYTGRTHQIRAHLSSIGYPILGDKKYTKNPKENNLHLLSYKLSFKLKGNHEFTAKIPKFLNNKNIETSLKENKIDLKNNWDKLKIQSPYS